VESLRLDGDEEIEVRKINGVKPVAGIAGPGSEKRTRFLVLCGVAGGVSMPYARVLAGLDWESRVVFAVVRRGVLRRAIGLLSLRIRFATSSSARFLAIVSNQVSNHKVIKAKAKLLVSMLSKY
jgi:hypothetical protein